MPYEIRYLPVENLVVARIEGELTLENVKQLHLGLSGEMEKYGLKGCLLEMMDVGNGLDTVGIYEIPRFYDSVGTDKSAMVAVVAGEENIKKEDILFYETVCRNRGYNIRVFTDRNSAVKWLRKEQS